MKTDERTTTKFYKRCQILDLNQRAQRRVEPKKKKKSAANLLVMKHGKVGVRPARRAGGRPRDAGRTARVARA
jgi:hypothetical protein